MVERTSNGLLRTVPAELVHPPRESEGDIVSTTQECMTPEQQRPWETWLDTRFTSFHTEIFEQLGDILDTLNDGLDHRFQRLASKLAEVRGAVDVLRGRGVPGLPNVRGTYRAAESYSALDVVALDGSSFVARRDAPGPCPGSGWQLLCQKGARGARGERGERGYPGVAPTWTATTFDTATLEWVPRMSDGTHGPRISAKMLFHSIEVDGFSLVLRAEGDGAGVRIDLRPMFQQFLDEVVSLRGSR